MRAFSQIIMLSRWARRFTKDRRGVTAVEFAILAAPFLSLIMGVFEISYVHLTIEGLQEAVSKASRQLLTGNAQGLTLSTAAQFRDTLLCPSSGRIMPTNINCNSLIIDVRTSTSFSASDTANDFYKSSTLYCPGAASKIVVVRVAYPLPSIFPLSLFSPYIGLVNDAPNTSGWVHLLMGEAVFQTEPFTSSNLPSC